jgi:hypothetical protein
MTYPTPPISEGLRILNTPVSDSEAIVTFLALFDPDDPTQPHSTWESALRDARQVMGTRRDPAAVWPGLMLYLISLELVGKYLRKRGVPPFPKVKGQRSRKPLELAIHNFGSGTEDSELAPTLYGLRCALVHEFGLRNAESKELTYMFALADDGPIFRPARAKWDGKHEGATNDNVTVVCPWEVAKYVEDFASRLRTLPVDDIELAPGIDAEELFTFGTFVIGPLPR